MFALYFFGCVLVTAVSENTSDDELDFGPGYGEDWLYFPDENGTTHVMNFSTLPDDARGFIFGDAYFHLYTRQNPEDPELLLVPDSDKSLNSSFFNSTHELKVLTHGWLSSDQTEWLQFIKNSIILKHDMNVITVDWSELAKNPGYPWPALCTRYVGKKLSKLLKSIMTTYNMSGNEMHLIGHSLGAQVMGYAGMFTGGQIARITGLDPARPLFELPLMPASYRLERSDACFVDIIHTCGGVYGYRRSHGHADFYPNNGRAPQPGCGGKRQMMGGCSHGRSCEFFGESVLSDRGFKAYPCDSWDKFNDGQCQDNATYMGYLAATDRWGDFYLHTNNQSEYAKNDE